MLGFYMDHQFPAAVTRGLRLRNIDVLTAYEDFTSQLDDALLLERSTGMSRVPVTHDHDFLMIAADWQAAERRFTGIVFAVQKSFHIGNAVEYLELMAHAITADEMENQVKHIPSRR